MLAPRQGNETNPLRYQVEMKPVLDFLGLEMKLVRRYQAKVKKGIFLSVVPIHFCRLCRPWNNSAFGCLGDPGGSKRLRDPESLLGDLGGS